MRHIIPISGKDSLTVALLFNKLREEHQIPSEQINYVFCDTRCELPEVYQWLDKVEQYLGKKIIKLDGDLPGVIKKKVLLPSIQMRYCTNDAKLKPFDKFCNSSDIVYLGIRYDEQNRVDRSYLNAKYYKQYPLIRYKITLEHIYQIIDNFPEIKPPNFFWKTLYNRVQELASKSDLLQHSDWESRLSFWQFDVLFAGRSRTNCYFCFFQRLYEFCWLSEVHPDLFQQAIEYELKSKTGFTWLKNYSLQELVINRDKIILNRADKIVKILESAMTNSSSVTLEIDDSVTQSCGIFCGK